MEKRKQIEQCMTRQCDFCRRKGQCDREIEEDKDYRTNTRTNK